MAERKPVSETAHYELWLKWKNQEDDEAKKSLIELFLPLVHYVSNRLVIGLPSNVSNDDLISYGIMGLIDAVEKYDIERGLQFETYASWRIRGAMIDGLRQADWVPRTIRDKSKKIEEAYQKLEQVYLRTVTDEEMSEYMNVTVEDFQQMLQEIAITTICSLQDPVKEDEQETRLSVLMDENVRDPKFKANEIYVKEALAAAIEKLTIKERTVVSLYYFEDLSLSEVAEVMSLTPSRISQLHSKAILRLRGSLGRNKNQLLYDS